MHFLSVFSKMLRSHWLIYGLSQKWCIAILYCDKTDFEDENKTLTNMIKRLLDISNLYLPISHALSVTSNTESMGKKEHTHALRDMISCITTVAQCLKYFNLSKLFYVCLMRQTLGRHTMAKYLINPWSQVSKFRWPNFHYFRQNWTHDPNCNFFTSEILLYKLRHSQWKNALDNCRNINIYKL